MDKATPRTAEGKRAYRRQASSRLRGRSPRGCLAAILLAFFLGFSLDGCRRSAQPTPSKSHVHRSLDRDAASSSLSGTAATEATAHVQESVILSGPFNDRPVESDYSGSFAALEVRAAVTVVREGQYWLAGHIRRGETVITESPYHHAPVNSSAALPGGSGVRQAVLRFSGEDILASGLDGPYAVRLFLMDSAGTIVHQADHTTAAYEHKAFGEYPARITGATERPIGSADRPYDGLEVQVHVLVTRRQASTYTLEATLVAPSGLVTSSDKQAVLPNGRHLVLLAMEGPEIQRRQAPGPYEIEVLLYDDQARQVSDFAFETRAYDPGEFRQAKPE